MTDEEIDNLSGNDLGLAVLYELGWRHVVEGISDYWIDPCGSDFAFYKTTNKETGTIFDVCSPHNRIEQAFCLGKENDWWFSECRDWMKKEDYVFASCCDGENECNARAVFTNEDEKLQAYAVARCRAWLKQKARMKK